MMRTVRFNNISKLSLLAISLSALFASCKDDNEDEAVVDRRNPNSNVISFSTYTAGATRATEVGEDELKASGFEVSAWYGDNFFFNDTALFENGLAIDNTTIPDAFDTENDTYYWPTLSATNKIKFRAFNKISGAKWTTTDCKWIGFNIKASADDQKDLVVAYADAVTKPANGVQPLNFMHALSKINFSFVGAEDNLTYTINKVEVIAAGEKDNQKDPVLSFREKSTSLQNAEEKFFWDYKAVVSDNPLVNTDDNASPAQGVKYTYFEGEDVEAGTETAPTRMDKNLMLLPQSGKIAIRVYYKVEDSSGELIGNCGYYKTDADGNHGSDGIYGFKTLIVDLSTQQWQPGYSYRYTLTLPKDNFLGDKSEDGVPDMVDDKDTDDISDDEDLDGDGDTDESEFGTDENEYIEFSVSVARWETVENNGNIIIK